MKLHSPQTLAFSLRGSLAVFAFRRWRAPPRAARSVRRRERAADGDDVGNPAARRPDERYLRERSRGARGQQGAASAALRRRRSLHVLQRRVDRHAGSHGISGRDGQHDGVHRLAQRAEQRERRHVRDPSHARRHLPGPVRRAHHPVARRRSLGRRRHGILDVQRRRDPGAQHLGEGRGGAHHPLRVRRAGARGDAPQPDRPGRPRTCRTGPPTSSAPFRRRTTASGSPTLSAAGCSRPARQEHQRGRRVPRATHHGRSEGRRRLHGRHERVRRARGRGQGPRLRLRRRVGDVHEPVVRHRRRRQMRRRVGQRRLSGARSSGTTRSATRRRRRSARSRSPGRSPGENLEPRRAAVGTSPR